METNRQLKAVFLDAADTLFFVKGGVGDVYWNVAQKYGADTTPQIIRKAFGTAFTTAPPLAFGDVSPEERKVLEKRWWYNVVKQVFEEAGMFERFDNYFDELFETFRTKAWELFPETKDVLTYLKRKGLKLGLVSNFDSRVYEVCTNLGIIGYFDTFVISSEAGFAKPAPQIFSIALKKTGVSSAECIHIGDNLKLDYVGARALGIKAYLLDREEKYRSHSEIDRIENLSEIIRIVG